MWLAVVEKHKWSGMAKQVDFGFEKVSADEKLSKVEAVFSSVSE